MEENKTTMTRWLETATAGIRFGPDRKAARAELWEHMEDKIADFQRFFPDITEEEAAERAVSEMGDAEEIGKELARIHKPWLGWLWVVSRWATALALAAALLLWIPQLCREAWHGWRNHVSPGIRSCYLEGKDPFEKAGSAAQGPEITRIPLAVFQPEERVRAGNYALRVEQAALWSFTVDGEMVTQLELGEGEDWELFLELRAAGWPWQPMSLEAVRRIRGRDSLGNLYYSTEEVFDRNVDRNGSGCVEANWKDSGFLEEAFFLDVSDIPPGAEWLRLEYDWSGTNWSLTIPLSEEVENRG